MDEHPLGFKQKSTDLTYIFKGWHWLMGLLDREQTGRGESGS